jgi:hypothetical protein
VCLRTDYVKRIQPTVEDRVWAIEGCNGIGHHITMRLLADGEQVVDVPPKLSPRARIFATGQGRKTDATDAHLSPWSAPGWPGCCGRWSTTNSGRSVFFSQSAYREVRVERRCAN